MKNFDKEFNKQVNMINRLTRLWFILVALIWVSTGFGIGYVTYVLLKHFGVVGG